MSRSVLYMSMSVDGYIAAPNDRPGNPGGDDFGRLHEWGPAHPAGSYPMARAAEALMAEIQATGAVLVGRRTAEQAEHWGGDHHGRGVPIFVLSRRPAPAEVADFPLVTYVDGIESAMSQAKAAAGDQDVLVHGASTAQSALEAEVLDEIQIHQVPVLLGGGRRLFDILPRRIELEIERVRDTPVATHIRYRVRH